MAENMTFIVEKETYFDVFFKKYPDKTTNKNKISKKCLMEVGLTKICPALCCRISSCYECWNAPKGIWDTLFEIQNKMRYEFEED